MRGEEISCASCHKRNVKRNFRILHEVSCSFEDDKRSVTFVEMTDFGLHSECAQKAPSPDSKYDFLGNPHLRSAAIEFTGNAAI